MNLVVRAELANETWAGTGRVVPAEIFSLTERELLGQDVPTRQPFFTFLAGAVLHTGPGLFDLGEKIFAIPVSALWS